MLTALNAGRENLAGLLFTSLPNDRRRNPQILLDDLMEPLTVPRPVPCEQLAWHNMGKLRVCQKRGLEQVPSAADYYNRRLPSDLRDRDALEDPADWRRDSRSARPIRPV